MRPARYVASLFQPTSCFFIDASRHATQPDQVSWTTSAALRIASSGRFAGAHMSMVVLAAICFVIGAMLGSRYRVFVLIPLNFFVAAAVIGVSVTQGFSAWQILSAVFLALTILQTGFLFGAVIGASILRRRAKKGSLVGAVKPQRLL